MKHPKSEFVFDYPTVVDELQTPILLSQASLHQADRPHKFRTYKAIWDTGATNTVVARHIVKNLRLVQAGVVTAIDVSMKKVCPTYLVDIKLPNEFLIRNLQVTEGNSGDDVLIGMDIIKCGDFFVTNIHGKTRFSFCHHHV